MADASFPGRNGNLVLTVDAACGQDREPVRHLRTFSPRGREVGPLTPPCTEASRDPDSIFETVFRETYAPTWAPDGSRLLFHQTDQSGLHQRMTVAADGSDPRAVPMPADAGDASFSSDGRHVVFIRSEPQWAVWTQPTDGSMARKLGRLPGPSAMNRYGEWRTPRWSPDGRFVALVADSGGNPSNVHGIWVMSARTGKLRRRVASSGLDPDWSPDGRSLVYRTEYRLDDPENRATVAGGNLHIVSADGAGHRRLVHTRRSIATAPTYSPDGKTIAWVDLRVSGSIEGVRLRAALVHRRAGVRGRTRHVARLKAPLVESEDATFNLPALAWQPLPASP